MLATAYNTLVEVLLGILGMSYDTPDMVMFWVNGFAMIATFFVVCLPFYIVYKIVGWLCA